MARNNRRKKSNEVETFPVVIYRLTEANEEYKQGFRYRVHDLDNDMFYFHDWDRMKTVLQEHAMLPVKPEEWQKLYEAKHPPKAV